MVNQYSSGSSAIPFALRLSGAILVVVGAAGYILPSGSVHWTALIPAILGATAVAASWLRNNAIVAGIGVLVAVLALFGGGSALAQLPALLAGDAGAAVASRSATALVAILLLGMIGYGLTLGHRSKGDV